jgi:hypothetical protein
LKSFISRGKKPICKWGTLPDNIFFEGSVPDGYSLCIVPSGEYIVLDVDRHGDENGFDHIPDDILLELEKTFNYSTKNNGVHYWLKSKNNVNMVNKNSGFSMDLRCHWKGYVVWYHKGDVRDYLDEINYTSDRLNAWLEELFKRAGKKKLNKKQKNEH